MIAIPNISKPKVCHECIAFRYEQGDYEPDVYCEITKEELFDATAIPTDCPLIEIVTCGECKYMRKYALRSDEPTRIWCHRWSVPRLVTDDDFCSYGKRK